MNYLLGYEQYFNQDIFTIVHSLGNDNAEFASGKIVKIQNYLFEHTIDTDYGSSGCPIISCGNLKVLGIHKGSCKNSDNNVGTFIGEITKFTKIQNIFESLEFNESQKDTFLEKYRNEDEFKTIKFLKETLFDLINILKILLSNLDQKVINIMDGVKAKKGETRHIIHL